ncbi:c-type cytochrome biogenesis protein CcmI [Candidatus Macondimonas diazotrophica]|jgi:cytochrome c-type biogenesis protein CcmH|uniref:C-type cytochrome biogenesis protein CcmI n=1 Tax=Candidatus Macondimonas diazotrophica TaxID=2305248 RepID=A0A4Z0FBG5_9GAMM|nr:c-type cytochrome biogenesis protein CcmI [Candidatus Macondimonas diazotrophica]NCU00932.1 c-type cytochrome biogenesis protein CcmI [Candidatus Macondimonas diazotrophica]TFZ83243.1 c-type cytochrome biogenesis protein CcmI [Candidatus Macondimonas diazotrophica]
MITTVFALICLVLALLAVGFVARPLWRGAVEGQSEADALLAIHRRKHAELAAELADGAIDAEQAQSRRVELEAALLDDWAAQNRSRPGDAPAKSRRIAGVLALVIPLLAGALYLQLGAWPVIATPPEGSADLDRLVDNLAERLAANPEEREGWILLGRSYAGLGRQTDAAQAFGKALALERDDPEVLSQRAQALALQSNPPQWAGEPAQLLDEALALDADHPRTLWLAGVAAAARGDAEAAGRHWRHLLTLIGPEAPVADTLRQALAQIGQSPESADSGPVEAAVQPGPTVRIALTPDLAATLSAETTVFVAIRDNPQGGMPVGAIRKQVADLPLSLVLTDEMSLMPTRRLSSLETLWISAHVSSSGLAQGATDDPRAGPVSARWQPEEAVSLVIGEQATPVGASP